MDKKQDVSFKCHKIAGGSGEGRALISFDDVCFFQTDPDTGIVKEKKHYLEGKSLANKILIFPAGKGSSVAQGEGIYQLTKKGTAPKAMVVRHPDTVLVADAVIWKIPLVDRVEEGFYDAVQDDCYVRVEADKGRVTIMRRGPE